MSQFMIEFSLSSMDEAFMAKIPAQRAKINELMEQGHILSYSLAADRSKLWCIVNADSELEVMETIANFPLIDYMKPDISELMFNNVVSLRVPMFSLN
ncbi:MAG TPA: muconolactone Delta-isomerase family protein [Fibrella sp.]|jgi:muconolactone delta-isomerase